MHVFRKMLILAAAAALIWAGGLFIIDRVMEPHWNASNESDHEVKQIASFTLKGCGSCTDALDAIDEVKLQHPDYQYVSYSITEDTDRVNQYAIKEHPTVLFLNGDGQELDRLEKQVTSEDLTNAIGNLSVEKADPVTSYEAVPSHDAMMLTAYLRDHRTGFYQSVTQFEEKNTQVNYPKVASLQQLFSLHEGLPDGLHNVIPETIVFQEIRSEGNETVVELSPSYEAISNTDAGLYVREAIALTLGEFEGVGAVRIVTDNYRSEKVHPDELAELISPDHTHHVTPSEDNLSIPRGISEYNAAILHRHELAYIPCFCGCGSVGHTSNLNCYFTELSDGSLLRSNHAENCQVCLDITNQYVEGMNNGYDLRTIREQIDRTYSDAEGTDTPLPS